MTSLKLISGNIVGEAEKEVRCAHCTGINTIDMTQRGRSVVCAHCTTSLMVECDECCETYNPKIQSSICMKVKNSTEWVCPCWSHEYVDNRILEDVCDQKDDITNKPCSIRKSFHWEYPPAAKNPQCGICKTMTHRLLGQKIMVVKTCPTSCDGSVRFRDRYTLKSVRNQYEETKKQKWRSIRRKQQVVEEKKKRERADVQKAATAAKTKQRQTSALKYYKTVFGNKWEGQSTFRTCYMDYCFRIKKKKKKKDAAGRSAAESRIAEFEKWDNLTIEDLATLSNAIYKTKKKKKTKIKIKELLAGGAFCDCCKQKKEGHRILSYTIATARFFESFETALGTVPPDVDAVLDSLENMKEYTIRVRYCSECAREFYKHQYQRTTAKYPKFCLFYNNRVDMDTLAFHFKFQYKDGNSETFETVRNYFLYQMLFNATFREWGSRSEGNYEVVRGIMVGAGRLVHRNIKNRLPKKWNYYPKPPMSLLQYFLHDIYASGVVLQRKPGPQSSTLEKAQWQEFQFKNRDEYAMHLENKILFAQMVSLFLKVDVWKQLTHDVEDDPVFKHLSTIDATPTNQIRGPHNNLPVNKWFNWYFPAMRGEKILNSGFSPSILGCELLKIMLKFFVSKWSSKKAMMMAELKPNLIWGSYADDDASSGKFQFNQRDTKLHAKVFSIHFCLNELMSIPETSESLMSELTKLGIVDGDGGVDIETLEDGQKAAVIALLQNYGYYVRQNRVYINRVCDRAWNIYRGLCRGFETFEHPVNQNGVYQKYGCPRYLNVFVDSIQNNNFITITRDDDSIMIDSSGEVKALSKEERCRYFLNDVDRWKRRPGHPVKLWNTEVCFHRKEGQTCTHHKPNIIQNIASETSDEGVHIDVQNNHRDYNIIPRDYILHLKSAPSKADLQEQIDTAAHVLEDSDDGAGFSSDDGAGF